MCDMMLVHATVLSELLLQIDRDVINMYEACSFYYQPADAFETAAISDIAQHRLSLPPSLTLAFASALNKPLNSSCYMYTFSPRLNGYTLCS